MSSVSDAGRRLAATLAVAWLVVAAGCTSPATDGVVDGVSPPATRPEPAPTPTAVGSASPPRPASPSPVEAASPSPEATPQVALVPLRVERRTDDPATARFSAEAMDVLTDPRGWQRAGFRFVQDEDATFLLVLAEGDQVDRLCHPYDTGGRFSCQNGPVVALNADRWREATPEWSGDLATYRTYLVNHEVGHLLHLHHPSPQCPAPGLPAPVMLQQSTELGGCTANPWPLPWEVDLAAQRREPLAPPGDHEVDDHRPSPPPQEQDLDHRAVQS